MYTCFGNAGRGSAENRGPTLEDEACVLARDVGKGAACSLYSSRTSDDSACALCLADTLCESFSSARGETALPLSGSISTHLEIFVRSLGDCPSSEAQWSRVLRLEMMFFCLIIMVFTSLFTQCSGRLGHFSRTMCSKAVMSLPDSSVNRC